MRIHRFVLMAVASCAMMALLGGGVRAGTITSTVATSGRLFQFTGTSPLALSSAQLTTLNGDLAAAGSAYTFKSGVGLIL